MADEKSLDRRSEDSQAQRSVRYKIVASLVGIIVFLVVIPAILYFASDALYRNYLAQRVRIIEMGTSVLCVAAALLWLAWAFITIVRVGKGTPVPLAPPERLIVKGPYRLCRNPLQLGVTVYYFGLGTYFGSLGIGITMLLIVLTLGAAYHKFVEERHLVRIYGEEYEEYRKRTPFLIPKL